LKQTAHSPRNKPGRAPGTLKTGSSERRVFIMTWLNRRVAVFVLALPIGAYAQVERALIVGTVTDSTTAAVPNVSVRVIEESTNTALQLQTDSAGEYRAANLTPGSYTIEAQKDGFNKFVSKGFVIQVGQTARLDINLQVGNVNQTVEVTGEIPVLQTENSSVGQVIGTQPINQLPLNGRNFAQLAILAPGVTGLSYSPAATIGSGVRPDELRPGGTTIEANGARDSNNKVMLDGIDDTEMVAQTFVVRPSVEGLQEFRVITSSAGAEFDRGAGAVVVTSTRSGSNQFHGSVFEFFRNSAMDAKNFFDRASAPIPPYRLNNFGARLGGPVIRNKTFFFIDYEGFFEAQAQTIVSTVPTAATRQGNFQGQGLIYDPLTTTPLGSNYTRTAFANNIIPASRFDPIAAQLVNLYPLPQTSGLVNNYVSQPVKTTDNNRADIRVDHQISSNQNFFARYSIDDAQIVNPNTFNNAIGGNEGQFAGPDAIRGQNGALAYTNVITPNVVGEYRFGFTRFTNFLLPANLTSPVFALIPGRNPTDPSAPIISPSGFGGLGDSRSIPLIRLEHMFENIASLSWQHGTHAFKFGGDFRRYLISDSSPPSQSPFGRFNFDNTFTNNPAVPAGTGNVMASMLLGFPSTTSRDFFLPGVAHVLTSQNNFYVSDTWRASRKLTLNIGVHYEINTPPHEANNYWANVNMATGQILLAGVNSGATTGVQTDYKSIGPRFGFAYQVNNKTVVRGGYGIFYDPQLGAGTILRQQRQWPFDLVYTITPGSLFPQNTVSQGFLRLSDIPMGVFAQPFGTLKGIPFNFQNADVQQYNVGVQRQINSTSSFTLSYVGALGRHLSWSFPADQPAPGPGNIQSRRPFNSLYPNVSTITFIESTGASEFNSLQAVFEKRVSKGVYFTANYVWSHSLDNAPYDGGADGPVPQDPTNRNADWASSSNDARQRLNIYGTYELPFGPGKAFLNSNSAVTRYLLSGWQVNGISVIQTGYPFTVTVTGSPTNTGATDRANIVPGVSLYPANQSINQWFNPAAFSIPTAYNWGNSGRNILRGPATVNFDFTMAKRIAIRESKELNFRAEFFNIFNHPQFTLPASTVGSAGLGTITATARPARQIQLVLRLLF
jgi:Carboxypeptidase regulatory-like domain